LWSDLVHADSHQVVLHAAVVLSEEVTAQEGQPVVFLPVVVGKFDHIEHGIRILGELRIEQADLLRSDVGHLDAASSCPAK